MNKVKPILKSKMLFLFLIASAISLYTVCLGSGLAFEKGNTHQTEEAQKIDSDQTEELQKDNSPQTEETKDSKKPSWWQEHLKFYGDFRLRYEMIKQEDKGYQNRARIRARLGLDVNELAKNFDLGFRIATGDGNPVSTNITLGDGFSKKFIKLDTAYFDWHPIKGLYILGGKIDNPFYRPIKSELVWDSDLTPEGASIKYKHDFGPANVAVNTGFFWISESSTDDTWLFGSQGILRYEIMEEDKLYALAGASYYHYTETKGKTTFYDPDDSFGNSVDAEGKYLKNYQELEAIGEFGGKIKEVPMAVFGQYVINLATSSNRQAWMAGFFIGKRYNPLRPAFRYNYRWVQKDAMLGLFTDSDFNGGDTNGKGHEFNLDFAITKKIWFAGTYFLNTKGLNNGLRYQRVQIDFNIKF